MMVFLVEFFDSGLGGQKAISGGLPRSVQSLFVLCECQSKRNHDNVANHLLLYVDNLIYCILKSLNRSCTETQIDI